MLRDDDDMVRVVLRRPSFAEVVDIAITQPRRYGSSDPQVMKRLFRLLEELAWHVDDERRFVNSSNDCEAPSPHRTSTTPNSLSWSSAAKRVEHAIDHRVGKSIP